MVNVVNNIITEIVSQICVYGLFFIKKGRRNFGEGDIEILFSVQ